MSRTLLLLVLGVSLGLPVSSQAARKGEVIVQENELLFPVTGTDDYEFSHETHSEIPPGCKVKLTNLHGGRQEGVQVLSVSNGKLTIHVVPTRGMSILSVEGPDGFRLGWDSPVKEVVNPAFINLESRGGLGWLEGFNEWMVRCGLEFAGHPGVDKFVNNTGDEAEMMLTLHGKIGNIPASAAVVAIERKSPHRIRILGTVNERMFYGPKLELVTEVSMVPGRTSFRIDDEIINHGAFDQEFTLIYHGNFGAPFLEEGAMIHTAAKTVAPMNAHAGKAIRKWQTYAGPTKGFIEEVYLFEPLADKKGNALAVLTSKDGKRAATVKWSTKELPYLTVWKNTAAKEDGYVTGIEPATGFPFNRGVERKAGRLPKLKAGKSRKFGLEFQLLNGGKAVDAALKQVTKLQGDHGLELIPDPPSVD